MNDNIPPIINEPPVIAHFIPTPPEKDYMIIIEKVEYNPSGMIAFGSAIFMLFAYTFYWLSSFKTTTEQYGPYSYYHAYRIKQLNPTSKILQISTNRFITI